MASVLLIFSIFVVGVFSYPLDSEPENDTAKDSFQPVSLPTDFGSYDPNANGYIDLEELAKVTGTTVDDARKPFMDADIDDDDQVSPAEFERAPWSLSLRNREDVVSEDDNDDDNEELKVDDDDDEEEQEVKTDGDDGEEEETPMDEGDDDGGEVPVDVDETDEEEAPTDESDYQEGVFDNADDMLVDVGKYSEDDADDEEKSLVGKSNEDEDNEKTKEEYDDDSQNIESDEVETDDAVDPLLLEKEDPLSRQEDVISENEFVENAIF